MTESSALLKIVIVYYSRFGVVRRLAECVAEGARRVEAVSVEMLEIEDSPIEETGPGMAESDMVRRRAAILNQLISADALIVGAPGYFGSMASPVKRLFEDCATSSTPPVTDRSRPWRHFHFHDKVGAAFTSTGTLHGGNEQTLLSILTMFMHFGMIVVTPGQQQPILEVDAAPYGATAISGPEGDRLPDAAAEEAARRLGERVAEVTIRLKIGSVEWSQRRDLRALLQARGSDHPA
jgi:NAD(P)H dehydrogenase (quinone)